MGSDHFPVSSKSGNTDIFDGYISEAEYCRQRRISIRTAQRDRQLRQAPPYTIIGNKVLYRIEAIREWLAERELDTGSKAKFR